MKLKSGDQMPIICDALAPLHSAAAAGGQASKSSCVVMVCSLIHVVRCSVVSSAVGSVVGSVVATLLIGTLLFHYQPSLFSLCSLLLYNILLLRETRGQLAGWQGKWCEAGTGIVVWRRR